MGLDHADDETSPGPGSKMNRTGGATGASAEVSHGSREATTARILDAAEGLFSRRDPAKVTVREIAEAAGVTHPLVHQYVGTKADVIAAVIDRGAPHRQRLMIEHPDLREAVPILFSDVMDRTVHSQAIVRSAMDGVEYAPFEDRLESGRALMALADAALERGSVRLSAGDAMDPRIALAAATAMSYGWVACEDWLVRIFALEEEEISRLREQVAEACVRVAELMFPPVDSV